MLACIKTALYSVLAIAATVAIEAGTFGFSTASAQKPDSQRGELYINYGPPPASAEELRQASELIVVGVVERSQVRAAGDATLPSVVTDHLLRVTEVIQGKLPEAGNTIHVLQRAGTMEVDGRQITVSPGSMPVLAPGQEALLFLTNWHTGGGFVITAGPAGLVILDDASLRPPPLLRSVFSGAKSLTRAQFVDGIRRWAGNKGAR
jgi:hypothetical protein